MSAWDVIEGDCLAVMATLPDCSIQTCVTSPPYFNLRDYGIAGQIGVERTPEAYVARLVEVFREVRRVLRDDGTAWLNLGDSYNAGRDGGHPGGGKQWKPEQGKYQLRSGANVQGLKPKDLLMMPHRVAIALQEDGWWVRGDIVWHKPNPMPESVTDRPTRAHEYIFLLAKNQDYYYDHEAIKEPLTSSSITRLSQKNFDNQTGGPKDYGPNSNRSARRALVNLKGRAMPPQVGDNPEQWAALTGRNKRDVWTVSTKPCREAHFATFPPDLIEPCILAGCPPAGKRCDCDQLILTPTGTGAIDDPTMLTGRKGMNRPRREGEGARPITKREQRWHAREMRESPHRAEMEAICGPPFAHYIRTDASGARPLPEHVRLDFMARGWITESPPCTCPVEPAGMVLDPFAGAGTTGLVAVAHGRAFTGIELNPDYCAIARRRIAAAAQQPALEGVA